MLKQRLMDKVEQTAGCWLWNGATNDTGYGVIAWPHRRKNMLASRASWLVHFGQIPDGLCVLHRCDNPRCIRPDHLFLGTRADNVADMIAKGRKRVARGAENGWAKLDASKVRSMRAMRAAGETLQSIANKFNVNFRTVHYATTGKTWAHIGDSQ